MVTVCGTFSTYYNCQSHSLTERPIKFTTRALFLLRFLDGKSYVQITGIFTPSDDLAKEVLAASEISGEKLWRMPLEESYWESMKSGVADMVNTGGRPGGAITAALFLKQVTPFDNCLCLPLLSVFCHM